MRRQTHILWFILLMSSMRGTNIIILIKTVVSDVVILAISVANALNDANIWTVFGAGRHNLLPIHSISRQIGSAMYKTLPVFHAFTGCDTVSSFYGCGKITAWNT